MYQNCVIYYFSAKLNIPGLLMIPFFIYHPTEQTFKKVHHMPEIGDRKKNKTKSLTLMISQIIP